MGQDVHCFPHFCSTCVSYHCLFQSLTPPELTTAQSPGFCCTDPHPSLTAVQALGVEFLATSVLILVVCACVDPRNADRLDSAPLKFGVTLMTLCVGTVSVPIQRWIKL